MYDTTYYALSDHLADNQINWTIKGPWRSPEGVPDVLNLWHAALVLAKKPGFKVLANRMDLRAEPHAVELLHM